MKTAVILFNLGGPDCPKAVRPFLYNLFSDPAIIHLPQPLRAFVAFLISSRREKTAQSIYAHLGGGSPILANTEAQARALELQLADLGEVKCFIVMRYWHPFCYETILAIEKFKPDQLVFLPLYPQFSATTTASSLKDFHETVRIRNSSLKDVKTKIIDRYPTEPGFIKALADNIRIAYDEALRHSAKPPRLLLSAHGLPEKIVQSGDPYPQQCEQTAQAVIDALKIPNLDAVLCYQSRVGPMKWIGPATDAEIDHAGQDQTPLVIAPIAFVSEHSETLVEIGIEYRHRAEQAGVPFFAVVPTVSTTPTFIAGLARLVRAVL